MRSGLFITFEGCDGVGKSLQSKLLHEHILNNKLSTSYTREIGGTKVSEQIRRIFFEEELSPLTQLMLAFAARSDHCQNIIIPKLRKNEVVICDRFIDSSVVYQGCVLDMPFKSIYDMHNTLFNNLLPDITFVLTLDYYTSNARIRERISSGVNKFDIVSKDVYNKRQDLYLQLQKYFSNRIYIIDGNGRSIDEIKNEIISIVESNEKYINLAKGSMA